MRLSGSPYRIYLLIRSHLLTHIRTYLIFTLFGLLSQLLLILFLRWVVSREEPVPDVAQYFLLYFVTWFSVTVMAVWFAKPLRSNPDQLMALILPCKPVERMVAVVLWVGIVLVLVLSALFYAAFYLSDLFPLVYSRPISLQSLFANRFLPGSSLFFATVMNVIVFYAGGVYFKRLAFIKTWLTLMAVSYGAALLAVVLLELFAPQFSIKRLWNEMFSGAGPDTLFLSSIWGWGTVLIQYASSLCYAALLWVLLREKQV
ncbi:MAG: hypothetical protein AB7C90_00170 [Bacteroidales bacterium]